MELIIPVYQDFNFEACMRALYRNAHEVLYEVDSKQVHRLIATEQEFAPCSIGYQADELRVSIHKASSEQELIENYVKRWFDTDRDLRPFYQLLRSHPDLQPLLEYQGLRIIGIPDLFEALCWTIIGQQINLSFAHQLKARLTRTFGYSQTWNNIELWHFPRPEDLLEISEEFRANNQFSRSKIRYLMNTAEAFADGTISFKKLQALDSFEERQSLLTQVKGIGEWSANYALMKTLHQAEAIPYGDTGLTQALYNLGIINDRKDRPAIEAFFETVKGWEAYTSFYLWRSLMN